MKFLDFSKIQINGLYDLKKEINKEYSIEYTYFDECFGISLNFNRKSYEENNLKPQDILTLMFSFKNIGSYKSSNLAVSENDKQDIEWQSFSIENDKFEKISLNYLKLSLLLITLFLYSHILHSAENKIIFKINEKVFTTLDYQKRVQYLDFVSNNSDLSKDFIINDFISANLFFEYYSRLNINIELEEVQVFENIKQANEKNRKEYNFKINKEEILFNIKIDLARKSYS